MSRIAIPTIRVIPRSNRFLDRLLGGGLTSVAITAVIVTLPLNLVALLTLAAGTATAQDGDEDLDYVWIVADDSGRLARYPGQILDYNERRLVLEFRDRRREFPSSQVHQIDTRYVAEHRLAEEHLAAGRFQEAYASFQRALRAEPRRWVQREIVAGQLRALQPAGQLDVSAEHFARLLASDRQTRFFDRIPLMWQARALSANESAMAANYRDSANPVFQLIGASWAIGGGEQIAAVRVLELLTTGSDARLAHLAAAQLWRTQVLTATREQVARWEQQVERMPESLRAGPRFVIGAALARTATEEQWVDVAAERLMRVPILHPGHYQLAGHALFTCGRLLEQNERLDEAAIVFNELLTAYRHSEAAERARSIGWGARAPTTQNP